MKHENCLQPRPEGGEKVVPLYPGVEMVFHRILSQTFSAHHPPDRTRLEVNYCHSGRIRWSMGDGLVVHLGSGDAAVQTMDVCADSRMALPLGHYEGITLCLDLSELPTILPRLSLEQFVGAEDLVQKLTALERPAVFHNNPAICRIFSDLFALPKELLQPYCRVRAQELLLLLPQLDFANTPRPEPYHAEQAEIIQKVHGHLSENLSQRITIEELSRQYHLNTTTLKAAFKATYGDSIAAYRKRCRMQYAADSLRQSTKSIAAIAAEVGYESGSKFAAAFKEEYGALPMEYRKETKRPSGDSCGSGF